MSLKDELVAACAPQSETVTISGVEILMVGLGANDQIALAEMGEGTDATFWILERMARDADGNRLFDDGDEALRGLGIKAIEELSNAALRLMGVQEQAKN